MDLVTQSVLGAALAQTVASNKEIRTAAVVGLFAGVLADVDILIQSSSDPLLMIEYHRHFTHSIFFIPFGALIASVLMWPVAKKHLNFKRLYVFSFFGYSLSGLIDACTSYGTHLLWPLMQDRIAFSIISIVDPVFTTGLLIGVVLAIKRKRSIFAYMGLLFAVLYMMIGWTQHERAWELVQLAANERGHMIERGIVKPTLGNLLVWRSVYQYKDNLYVDGVRIGLFSKPKFYMGQQAALFSPEEELKYMPKDLALYQDILRFIKFSDGYVSIHPDTPHILGDIRYASKPLGIKPLWGIEMDLRNPQYHAQYKFYRDLSKQNRQQYFDMLMGRDLQVITE